jgi:hypothetical protein
MEEYVDDVNVEVTYE